MCPCSTVCTRCGSTPSSPAIKPETRAGQFSSACASRPRSRRSWRLGNGWRLFSSGANRCASTLRASCATFSLAYGVLSPPLAARDERCVSAVSTSRRRVWSMSHLPGSRAMRPLPSALRSAFSLMPMRLAASLFNGVSLGIAATSRHTCASCRHRSYTRIIRPVSEDEVAALERDRPDQRELCIHRPVAEEPAEAVRVYLNNGETAAHLVAKLRRA